MNGDGSPTIKTGIPLPPRNTGRAKSARWAFLEEMDVGSVAIFDEFETDDEKRAFRKQAASIVYNRNSAGTSKVFAVRTIEQGIGIWRTA